MKNNAIAGEAKGDYRDCYRDFNVLPIGDKRGILKTAKNLLKEQNKVKTLLANAGNGPMPTNAEKTGE